MSNIASNTSINKPEPAPPSWRDVLKIHPAAELFPLMAEAELRELGEDIRKNGLIHPIILTIGEGDPLDDDTEMLLLDGRNRLDALELVGALHVGADQMKIERQDGSLEDVRFRPDYEQMRNPDPYAYVIAANIHRRHLSAEQKRDLIAKLLKAKPEASNVTIAKQVKADDKTVASVRRNLEATSEIPRLTKTVGKDGKARPAKISAKARKPDTKAAVVRELAKTKHDLVGLREHVRELEAARGNSEIETVSTETGIVPVMPQSGLVTARWSIDDSAGQIARKILAAIKYDRRHSQDLTALVQALEGVDRGAEVAS